VSGADGVPLSLHSTAHSGVGADASRRAIGAADSHPFSVRRFAPAIKRLQRAVVRASELAPAADLQRRYASGGPRMVYVKFLAAIAFTGSIAWVIADPGFEPALAVVGSISALVSAYLVERRNARRAQQQQSVSKSSIGVQAGGDVSIGSISGDKHSSKDQEQNVAEGSTPIQAGGNVTITKTGLTYAEVRDIALDVYRANFYKLAGVAKETAKARAEEITEGFLSKLQKEHPAGLEKANDPDFQYALFTVQKEYARNGDKDLGDLLVDLLVDRSKHNQRDILQIVLNESLSTAPKLTENQLAVVAVIFLFGYTQNLGIRNHQMFAEYLDKHVAPFATKVVKNMACYQHLQFTGCGAIGLGARSLESILGMTYQGEFLKGFDAKEVTDRGVSIGVDPRFFMPCLNDPSKMQVRVNSKELLDKNLEAHAITPEDRAKISALFDVGKMNETEIKEKCVEIRPYMSGLIETWSESAMKNFTLTSVGIAIGHANIKRFVGEFADLSIWIN